MSVQRDRGRLRPVFLAGLFLLGPVLSYASDVDEELYQAVQQSRPEEVERCLKKGANPNRELNPGWSPHRTALTVALSGKEMEIAQLLMQYGGRVDLQSGAGQDLWNDLGASKVAVNDTPQPLYYLPVIDFLLSTGIDINTVTPKGEALLHAAVGTGNLDLARALLERGANAAVKTADGRSALHLAAWRGDVDLIKLLLAKGVLVDVKDREGRTALWKAVANGQPEAIKLLLESGATIRIQDVFGRVAGPRTQAGLLALLAAGIAADTEALQRMARSGQWDLFQAALEHGSKPDAKALEQAIWWQQDARVAEHERGQKEFDPGQYREMVSEVLSLVHDAEEKKRLLFLAIGKADAIAVEALIEHEANPNWTDQFGRTALMAAAGGSPSLASYDPGAEPAVVEALLNGGASVNTLIERDGRTALIEAVIHNKPAMVELLLDHGADPTIVDAVNLTAPMIAGQNGNAEILKVFADRGIEVGSGKGGHVEAFLAAAASGEVTLLAELLPKVPDVNVRDRDRHTGLTRAILRRHPEVVGFLLNHGANPNVQVGTCEADISAPLSSPLSKPQTSVDDALRVAALSRVPAPRTFWDCRTPLILAVETDLIELVRLLLKHGADPNLAVITTGVTPLMKSAEVGDPEVVQLLLTRGADASLTDHRGKAAYDYAESAGNTKAARLIREAFGTR